MQQKHFYAEGKALVFHDIDFLMITIRLIRKDYNYLADHLVPIGEQKSMDKAELAAMLRTKTRALSDEEIRLKFRQKGKAHTN